MKAFLIELIIKVFKALFKASKPTMVEGAGKGKLEESLQDKIKKDGWE